MHLRIATTRDLHRLAEITTSSLKDDPAFEYMWPKWREYPEDNFFFWQLKLKEWLFDKTTVFIVAVTETGEPGPDGGGEAFPGTIMSYCIWERLGSSDQAKRIWGQKNTWQNMLDALNTSVEQWSISQKYVRRDADFRHLEALGAANRAIGEKYWSDVPELWNLELIVTHRQFRRRGAATLLIKHGCAKADEEDLPCRVEASPMGRLAYASCGFKELGSWDVQLPNDPASLHMWCMGRDKKKDRKEFV